MVGNNGGRDAACHPRTTLEAREIADVLSDCRSLVERLDDLLPSVEEAQRLSATLRRRMGLLHNWCAHGVAEEFTLAERIQKTGNRLDLVVAQWDGGDLTRGARKSATVPERRVRAALDCAGESFIPQFTIRHESDPVVSKRVDFFLPLRWGVVEVGGEQKGVLSALADHGYGIAHLSNKQALTLGMGQLVDLVLWQLGPRRCNLSDLELRALACGRKPQELEPIRWSVQEMEARVLRGEITFGELGAHGCADGTG